MTTIVQRSALVMHSAEQMYNLVNDVEAYPLYMEDCHGAEILERGEDYMVARLDLHKAGLSYSFTTRNTLIPFTAIIMELHSGPFRHLRGEWQFKPLTPSACKVSLQLEFEIHNGLLNMAASRLFSGVANNLVGALTARAAALYGVA
ncbi:MAG TPA: type II toxin-antitoxin system RatA family toxin [Porticoccaceae bacterium]